MLRKKLDDAEAQISAQQQRLDDGQRQYVRDVSSLQLRYSAERQFAQAEAQDYCLRGSNSFRVQLSLLWRGLASLALLLSMQEATFTQQRARLTGRDAYSGLLCKASPLRVLKRGNSSVL